MLKIFSGLLLLSVYANAASFELYEQLNLLFLGAFGMIVLYNLAYYLVIKDKAYADYFLFHVLVFVIMLFYTGVFDDGLLEFSMKGVPVGFFLLAVLALLSFSRNFLNLQKINSNADKYIIYLQYPLLVLFALSVFPITNTISIIVNIAIVYIILLAFLLVGISSYLSLAKKEVYAYFYLVGLMGLLISVIIAFLSYFDVLDLSPKMTYIIEFSLLLESIIFSFAISYKHKDGILKLRQNELLFKELSHRVQNNLQSIISILTLQQSRVKEIDVKEYLQDTISRIRSISLMHENLQNSKHVGAVNMSEYLDAMLEPYKVLNKEITFTLSCKEDLFLSVEKLTPLALIINELITNSIKHAFLNIEDPKVSITLKKENTYSFIYADNGVGYDKHNKSLGSLLIQNLSTSQLKGEYSVDSKEKYLFSLKF
ncbi:histidine kinase [Sulfurimonas aquatica]|uniref:histidine kinase n=1 Tax=Sulfurimonas aquatica TaxID=2672570 RepID=A0A975B119_9BACT|nr:7TM diverse intracellular signaling domain-containing protein [Sulfurimonas aquatica]QSZ42178.1 histidine kinase [Sulfurimonas aquatica]